MADKHNRLPGLYVKQYSYEQKYDNDIFDDLVMKSFPQIDQKEDNKRENGSRYNVVNQTYTCLLENIRL